MSVVQEWALSRENLTSLLAQLATLNPTGITGLTSARPRTSPRLRTGRRPRRLARPQATRRPVLPVIYGFRARLPSSSGTCLDHAGGPDWCPNAISGSAGEAVTEYHNGTIHEPKPHNRRERMFGMSI
jgi:hypothetical protein